MHASHHLHFTEPTKFIQSCVFGPSIRCSVCPALPALLLLVRFPAIAAAPSDSSCSVCAGAVPCQFVNHTCYASAVDEHAGAHVIWDGTWPLPMVTVSCLCKFVSESGRRSVHQKIV